MGSLDKALAYYQDRLYFNIPFTFSSLHEYLNLENFLMKIQFTQPLIIFTLSCIFSSLRLIFLLFFFIAYSIPTHNVFLRHLSSSVWSYSPHLFLSAIKIPNSLYTFGLKKFQISSTSKEIWRSTQVEISGLCYC